MPRRSRRYSRKSYSINKGRSFGRRKRSPEAVFWTVLVIVLALLGSGFIIHELVSFPAILAGAPENNTEVAPPPSETEVEEITPASNWEPKAPGEYHNILLLGVDNHGMGDAMIILSHHLKTNRSALISVKRDTYIKEHTWGAKELGQDHLAWAYYRGLGADQDCHGGAGLCAQTLEQLLDIEIHSFASISFEGFEALIEQIGGVEINVPTEFSQLGGSSLPSGRQRLDGSQAIIYARHRMNPRIPEPGSASEDGDRVRRNQLLIKAILEQSRSKSDEQLLTVFEQLEDKICTSLEYWDILELINLLYHSDQQDFHTYVLPGEGQMVYQELIDQEIYYFILDSEGTAQILREWGLW